MEFKDKLKKLRLEGQLSQESLGKIIYVSRSAIAKWENGLGLPSEDSKRLLCEYFMVNEDELFPNGITEELLVDKNINIHQKLKKWKLVLTGLSLLVFVLIFSGSIILGTKTKVEASQDSYNIHLQQYLNDDTLYAVVENIPIENNENGYIYTRMEVKKIPFTTKSSLYSIVLDTTFVPGSAAYVSDDKKYNKNGELKYTNISIELAQDPSLSMFGTYPKGSDSIDFVTSAFSSIGDYAFTDSVQLDCITLFNNEKKVKVEYQYPESAYKNLALSKFEYEMVRNKYISKEYINQSHCKMSNTMRTNFFIEKNNASSVYEELTFNICFEMKINNVIHIKEITFYGSYE